MKQTIKQISFLFVQDKGKPFAIVVATAKAILVQTHVLFTNLFETRTLI